ncbi:MAG: response regulator [Deltaproteobacteria bacterium]|nr:response regulator [Deltaproteobacteria bacterium]
MRKYEILLVDDDPFILKSIGPALESEGYNITTADNGKEAVEMVARNDFDLVLTDMVMESVDGMDVLKAAKEVNPDTMVIILTGYADMASAIDAFRLGVDDYIPKPSEPQEMYFRVERCLENLEIKKRVKQAEEALRESEERFRMLFQNSTDGIIVADPGTGKFIYVNPAICKTLGYTEEELTQMSVVDIHPKNSLEHVVSGFEAQARGEKLLAMNIPCLKKDGTIIYMDIKASMVKMGEKHSIMGVFRDITERKHLEAKLQQAQKMEAIGILSGGFAHDFNNLLSIITGNIELAKDNVKPESGISEYLDEAEEASLRAQKLTNQLITFSKGGAPVKKAGSIGVLVKKITNIALSNSKVKCEYFISNDLYAVEFDQGQMKHAVKNLIVNAVESMPDGGLINLKAENININSETTEKSLPLSEGKYVKISIRDHGVGIPEKHLPKIFDPYFSTKEMGTQKGMGLGLATTYSIINRHGGHIIVESEVGTTFTLFLPAHEKDIRELKPIEIHEPEKPSIRTGRILVMDDEESIRNLSKQRLGRLGYESELAKDGAQAIELYKKSMDSGQPFDLVILDLTIKGGMGGKDVIKELLKIDPKVKAIISSGYSNDSVMTNFTIYGFKGILPKPNTKQELIETLKNIIKE